MFFNIVMFCLLICFIGLYCKIFFEKDNIKTFVIKIIASSLFLSIGLYSLLINKNINISHIIVFIGLCMCVIGDVVIGLRRIFVTKKNLFMMLGMGFFLLAHFIYSASFIMNLSEKYFFAYSLVVVLWLGFVLLLKYTKIDFGKFLIPCYLYILTASTMFSISLFGFINNLDLSSMFLFIGICLFIISDVFLCYTYFKTQLNRPKLIKCISVITYFMGQSLIAFSIFMN